MNSTQISFIGTGSLSNLKNIIDKQRLELEKISGISQEEARKRLEKSIGDFTKGFTV